jgi:hypothetical protein
MTHANLPAKAVGLKFRKSHSGQNPGSFPAESSNNLRRNKKAENQPDRSQRSTVYRCHSGRFIPGWNSFPVQKSAWAQDMQTTGT